MTEVPDIELLERFSGHESEAAFAEIVKRHVGLVHSVALRNANEEHAQDITQAVFIILARKAGSLGRKTVLPGWLYHTARLTAANFRRSESRRIRREQEAFMQSTTEENPPDAIWRELSPMLEEAMAHLRTTDRDALVLRYFQNKSLPEVGSALGIEGRAAQKRVTRALEKLRKVFSKRGVALSATLIAGAISANSIHAAPAGLANAVSTIGITKEAAASSSILTIVKGSLKFMAWTKAKMAIGTVAVVLLAAGTTTVVTTALARKDLAVSADQIYEKIWANPNSDSMPLLMKAPPAFIIRPTRYPGKGGGLWADDGKGFWVNDSVAGLIQTAYDWSPVRTVLPANMPKGNFDVMEALPKGQNANAFKAEIEKQFGLVAHPEVRETEVLLVTVKDTGALKAYLSDGRMDIYRSGDDKTQLFHFKNARVADVAATMEGFLGKPMIDRSGSMKRYTFDVHWDSKWTGTDQVGEILREQLVAKGIELSPSSERIKMLVVEKK
jgi:uncharacterized protein (TIGR03435 family)